MNTRTLEYIKNHLNEINNNNWDRVFPISLVEDILDFDDINVIYESLINAGIYIDLETLFKKDYNFTHCILRDKSESLDEFEDRALKQIYQETTQSLAGLFNEFTLGYIQDSLRASYSVPIDDYDLSGSRDTKPQESKLILILSQHGYPIYKLNFTNNKVGDELQFRVEGNQLENNAIYLPYGIGYNLDAIKKDMDTLIEEIESEVIG